MIDSFRCGTPTVGGNLRASAAGGDGSREPRNIAPRQIGRSLSRRPAQDEPQQEASTASKIEQPGQDERLAELEVHERLDAGDRASRDAGRALGEIGEVGRDADLDAAGLAAYATYGAAKALSFGVAPVPAFVMGVLTACAGGIIRDVLAGEPSILMRPELYVTAAALSSGLFVGLALLGLSLPIAGGIAAIAGFTLRGLAIARGWSLPAYND